MILKQLLLDVLLLDLLANTIYIPPYNHTKSYIIPLYNQAASYFHFSFIILYIYINNHFCEINYQICISIT